MNRNEHIGVLKETSLHAALKERYALPGDQIETPLDGHIIDILRGNQLIEIQTRNFSGIKPKIISLLDRYSILLVYPIAQEKWITRYKSGDNQILSRRRSPRHGRLEDLFRELVRFPHLVLHPNFSLEVLLIRSEEVWRDDGKGSWRRSGWSIGDRHLLNVFSIYNFHGAADYQRFLPVELAEQFTSSQVADTNKIPARLASKMMYCLRIMGLVEISGKSGRAYLYRHRGSY